MSQQHFHSHMVLSSQGSVLGPLLFFLSTSMTSIEPLNTVECTILQMTPINVSNSPKQMQKQVDIDLKLLYKWLLANKISLNCSKTELIIFRRRGSNPDNFHFKIKLNGLLLQTSTYIILHTLEFS